MFLTISISKIIIRLYEVLTDNIYGSFIREDRYRLILGGIMNTIYITAIAAFIGVVIGLIMAIAKIAGNKPIKKFAEWYISVIRGTPTVVQLIVIYFIVLGSVRGLPKLVIASIAFGINSGAYVAEIIRAGIEAVDKGQMEAGRSLGLSYGKTMRFIIIPQAIKNILPALGNEFIVLLKETAIVGYIGLQDLTRAATAIQTITYNPTMPMFTVAYVYFLMTMGLSFLLSKYERRLKKSD
ncbi:MAG TPA: amino acid ABC transporter permease [Clostridia bacterium]|nr:amino acid ABC transporter permease [Clostridia bacterium]